MRRIARGEQAQRARRTWVVPFAVQVLRTCSGSALALARQRVDLALFHVLVGEVVAEHPAARQRTAPTWGRALPLGEAGREGKPPMVKADKWGRNFLPRRHPFPTMCNLLSFAHKTTLLLLRMILGQSGSGRKKGSPAPGLSD